MSVTGLQSVPKEYTLALDGSVQCITDATDVNGTQWDGTGLLNKYANILHLQNSNGSSGPVFIAYLPDPTTPPVAIDKTNCGLDLAIGQAGDYPRSDYERLRGDQINCKNIYVQGGAGDYLHIIVPGRG